MDALPPSTQPYSLLITDTLSPAALAEMNALDNVVFNVVNSPTQEQLAEMIPAYDALIIRSSVRVDAAVLARAERLQVIGRAGVGIDNIDIQEASLRGVLVMNTPDAITITTAEHTMGLLLALCRHIGPAHESMRAGQWKRNPFVGIELNGKTLGLVGLGRIGLHVARRAQAFGMHVIAADPYINDKVAHDNHISLVPLDDVWSQSDIISLHTVLTAETQHYVNARTIARMRPGVRLINTARGGLIDEEALIAALRSGHVAGVALDTFTHEPLAADSPLRSLPNVLLTPHLAASTVEAQHDAGTQIVRQVLAALQDKNFTNAVNMPVRDTGLFQQLGPYLQLAERLGTLQTELSEGAVEHIEIGVYGSDIAKHYRLISLALIKGLLNPLTNTTVNYINALHLAKQRGITLAETTGELTTNYANVMTCRVSWPGGERYMAGSLLGQEAPRLVQIDAFVLDARIEGTLLVIENIDRPGVIGRIGSLLGAHGINIAEWRLGRNTPGEHALAFVNLDAQAPAEVLEELRRLDDVVSVRQVYLP